MSERCGTSPRQASESGEASCRWPCAHEPGHGTPVRSEATGGQPETDESETADPETADRVICTVISYGRDVPATRLRGNELSATTTGTEVHPGVDSYVCADQHMRRRGVHRSALQEVEIWTDNTPDDAREVKCGNGGQLPFRRHETRQGTSRSPVPPVPAARPSGAWEASFWRHSDIMFIIGHTSWGCRRVLRATRGDTGAGQRRFSLAPMAAWIRPTCAVDTG